jgi:lipoprotein-anchoring transpeptidase ErfK/SrfK
MKKIRIHKTHKSITIVICCVVAVVILLLAAIYFKKGSNVATTPVVPVAQTAQPVVTPPVEPKVFTYIEIHDACNWASVGPCVNLRSGAGTEYPSIAKLRNGIVLKVDGSVVKDGVIWHKVAFDEWLRYPERVKGDLYVAETDSVRVFTDQGSQTATHANTTTTKHIVVDRSEQMLYAYDGKTIFMKEAISTGLELTPTPRGWFYVLRKTPTRYMQGPIPGISDQYYDLPGVPWDVYFTAQGGAIHGAYWHNNFGQPWSHGCVNLPIDKAEKLYKWADVGTPVLVQD